MNDKTKNIISWTLTGIVSVLFLFSAFTKFLGSEEVTKGFQDMGLDDNARLGIAVVELLAIVLFIIPRTGVLGTVLLIGYMGGTIMAHLSNHQPFVLNIVIGILIGVTGYIRFPELGQRLFGK